MSNSDVSVIWLGPVNASQAHQSDAAAWVTCTGDGQPTCGEMADARGGSIRSLAESYGIAVEPAPRLVLRAFSAGGSAIKRYLQNTESRSLVLAVTLSDGTYETTPGHVAPGFLAFGVEAATGDKLFVATASSTPNKSYPTGEQTLQALREAIERETGKTFETVEVPGLGQGMRLGGCWFFPEGSAYKHAEHATVLAPIVWSQIVKPFLDARSSSPSDVASPALEPLVVSAQASSLGASIGPGLSTFLILVGLAGLGAAAWVARSSPPTPSWLR